MLSHDEFHSEISVWAVSIWGTSDCTPMKIPALINGWHTQFEYKNYRKSNSIKLSNCLKGK